MRYSVIVGNGSFIPWDIKSNNNFLDNVFCNSDSTIIKKPTKMIIANLEKISGIKERRYANKYQVNSDLAFIAASNALTSSGIDKNTIDAIIVCTNFFNIPQSACFITVPSHASCMKKQWQIGDPEILAIDLCGRHKTIKTILPIIAPNSNSGYTYFPELKNIIHQYDPSETGCLAERVLEKLGIANPNILVYDLIFGCPGFVLGMIHADKLIKDGLAKRVLVIGSEILSRVADPHDPDCMLYADGAGAMIIEAIESDTPVGIISYGARSDVEYNHLIYMGQSYSPDPNNRKLYLKMNGREVFKNAVNFVPNFALDLIDKAHLSFSDISKIFMHQANTKLNQAILEKIFKIAQVKIPKDTSQLMPMTISLLGNSSVATVPTLYDLVATHDPDNIFSGRLSGHKLNTNDHFLFVSVGAGMNIAGIIYRNP